VQIRKRAHKASDDGCKQFGVVAPEPHALFENGIFQILFEPFHHDPQAESAVTEARDSAEAHHDVCVREPPQ
jgi:hypothetical protein